MASVAKFTHKSAVTILRHCERQIKNDSNSDIDNARSHLNYSLTPERDCDVLTYYKQRKTELYCYNRADVKTLCGWIVTAPQELSSPEEEREFFKGVYAFLQEKYGEDNIISATVHYDEGKTKVITDRCGNPEKNEDGNVVKEVVYGRPHIHVNFIPVVADKKHAQGQKICANDVLTKKELQNFHLDLQKYLKSQDVKGADGIITGAVKAQGRNRTVKELKNEYETKERLTEIERERNVTRW